MLSVVRLSSVTFVRPTQLVEIFDNVSMPFGTLVMCWHPRKILRISSKGNLSVGGGRGVNARGVTKYSDFGPIECCISETVKIRGKLVLTTNRKSYMSFHLYQNR